MSAGSMLFSPGVQPHLHALYDDLRATDPVHWADPPGFWLLTRYADVVAAFRDPRLISGWPGAIHAQLPATAPEDVRAYYATMTKMLIFIDPPDHGRVRRTMSKGFTPQVVERMRAVSQDCVDRLLDTLQDQREADLIQDLAYPFPMIMICEMLGVRPEDRARFKAWSDDLALVLINPAASPSQVAQGYRSLRHLMDYFQDLIAERRTQPKDDLLQHLIVAHEQDPTLSEDELLVTCAGLLFAGHETTTNLIGNGLLALLRHPDQLRRLQQDPALIGPAVEELLRYDGPVQMLIRLAAEDLDIGGKRIARGQLVVLMPGAANRDPEHFDQPGRLDITRSPNRQLGFGAGRHSCLGSPLGQMEAEVAITTVVRRLPGLRLAREDLTWNENPAIRGLKALPVSY